MTNSYKVDALVLGGGSSESIDGSSRPKGLIEILEKPMIEWVVDALKAAEHVDRVAVVFPDLSLLPEPVKEKADILVESNKNFSDNLLAGTAALNSAHKILSVTGDIPALTGEAVDDLVKRVADFNADFAYAVIAEEDIETQFPGSVRTFLELKSGKITGGNIAVLTPGIFESMRENIQVFFDARKSPIQTAKLLGPSFMARFALGQLSLSDIEKKMNKLLGAECRAILTPYASIGADVDKAVDKEVIERVLSENLQASS